MLRQPETSSATPTDDELWWASLSAYLTELRVQTSGNPEGRAIIDRCLLLVSKFQDADPATLPALEAEISSIRLELERLYGPPKVWRSH